MTFSEQGDVGALINRDAERERDIEGLATRTEEPEPIKSPPKPDNRHPRAGPDDTYKQSRCEPPKNAA